MKQQLCTPFPGGAFTRRRCVFVPPGGPRIEHRTGDLSCHLFEQLSAGARMQRMRSDVFLDSDLLLSSLKEPPVLSPLSVLASLSSVQVRPDQRLPFQQQRQYCHYPPQETKEATAKSMLSIALRVHPTDIEREVQQSMSARKAALSHAKSIGAVDRFVEVHRGALGTNNYRSPAELQQMQAALTAKRQQIQLKKARSRPWSTSKKSERQLAKDQAEYKDNKDNKEAAFFPQLEFILIHCNGDESRAATLIGRTMLR